MCDRCERKKRDEVDKIRAEISELARGIFPADTGEDIRASEGNERLVAIHTMLITRCALVLSYLTEHPAFVLLGEIQENIAAMEIATLFNAAERHARKTEDARYN